jgi:L-threonylcarbamoyladenylate synthase
VARRPSTQTVAVNDQATRVKVDQSRPDGAAIERAAGLIRAGRLVAFPTETVYGLGADAGHTGAVAAVFRGKGRPATDPLIVHVPSADAAGQVVADWPAQADLLAAAFWPGPLTLVLPKAEFVLDQVTAGRGSVAVRVPAHPVAMALLLAAGVPVAAPSANRFGRVSPTCADHVEEELSGVYDLLLDGGATPLGLESTVVDLSSGPARMLRPGAVTLEDLQDVIGPVLHRERTVVLEDRSAAAPGEFLRHYAPSTPLVLVEGDEATSRGVVAALRAAGLEVAVLELPAGADRAAQQLYAALREADRSGGDLLLARTVDPGGLGRAVNDRLFRAAHGRVLLDAAPPSIARALAVVGDRRP